MVAAVGAGVSHVSEGDKVMITPLSWVNEGFERLRSAEGVRTVVEVADLS